MSVRALAVTVLLYGCVANLASAEDFHFGSGQYSMLGLETVTVTEGAFELNISAGPAGSVFNDLDSAGFGINSIAAVGDPDPDKINLLGGTGPGGEHATFSFSRDGVLTGLDFDGVKDETFEYFALDFQGAAPIYFFDSAADPSMINVDGTVVFLLEDDIYDDEVIDLSIPFVAGQEMILTYGQLGAGNGSRFEGITVQIPEPSACVLVGFAMLGLRRLGR